MLSTIEMSIRILLKLNVPRILVLVLVHLPNGKVNFVIMTVTFPFVAQVTINLMMQKEIASLKRELRDAQDALDVLKKAISILGKS